jgi:hypothetical protein
MNSIAFLKDILFAEENEKENELNEAKKKKKDDRCVRIAKRKFRRWPSAYASGLVVQCRQGRVWRKLKEEYTDAYSGMDEEYVNAYSGMNEEDMLEEQEVYEASTDISNEEYEEKVLKEIIDIFSSYSLDEGKKFKAEKEKGLHGWFSRNRGKGWIDCRTGKSCGRQEGEKRKYPACRPTKAMCNKVGPRRKKGRKAISWVPKSKQK